MKASHLGEAEYWCGLFLRRSSKFAVLPNVPTDPARMAYASLRIPRLLDQVETATARYWTTMERHKLYISEHGDDMPEVRNWRWNL
jgi:hypothetical protein